MKPKARPKTEIYLFQLFGFKVSIDWTWFFLALLITWTLAYGYFPMIVEGLSRAQYWLMAIFGALGLFISVIIHELSHSLIGRIYDLPIKGIKLFIFGGIAEMSDEPPSPKAEFLMALAGPVASILLGILFGFIYELGRSYSWPLALNSIFGYLSFINYVLAIFNMLPGFPLDGGRVLRSILWWWKKDLKWATEIATRGGIGLGIALIILGVLNIFLFGHLIAGIWLCLIGFFIQHISKLSLQQTLIKITFKKESIKAYTKTDVKTVNADMSVKDLVENYFYKYYHKLYPVLSHDKLIGCVCLDDVLDIPESRRWNITIREVMKACSDDNSIDAHTKVNEALQMMSLRQKTRFIVIENKQLYGIITLKDLMDVIAIKTTLESP